MACQVWQRPPLCPQAPCPPSTPVVLLQPSMFTTWLVTHNRARLLHLRSSLGLYPWPSRRAPHSGRRESSMLQPRLLLVHLCRYTVHRVMCSHSSSPLPPSPSSFPPILSWPCLPLLSLHPFPSSSSAPPPPPPSFFSSPPLSPFFPPLPICPLATPQILFAHDPVTLLVSALQQVCESCAAWSLAFA